MSASLPGLFNFQALSDAGLPLVGGRLYTYAAGTTTHKVAYTDAAATVPQTYVSDGVGGLYIALNARGELPAPLFLAAGGYDIALKTLAGVTVWTRRAVGLDDGATALVDDVLADFASTSDAANGAGQVGFSYARNYAANTIGWAIRQQAVNVMWAGAKNDGTTDDRAAIQTAINYGKAVYFPAGTGYYISDQITPLAGQMLFGDGANSKIVAKDGSVNAIYGTGANVTIRDFSITTKTQANATAYKAAVLAFGTSGWLIENVTVTNMGHWGVALYDTNDSIVRGCRFSGWFGAVQDSADIAVYRQSSRNTIEGNYCLGGAPCEHGILVQDPYAGSTPTANSIIDNVVGEHTYAGIIVYVTTAYNTLTLVSGNHVQDILGTALAGQSGHGIYIQSAGGTIVSDNTVTNCCRSTTTFETQVVAAIGVATGNTTTYPTGTICEVVVANNRVTAQRGPGISIQDSDAPVTVDGNTILSTGTAAVRGEAIYCANAVGVQIKGNSISHANTNYQAININASDKTVDGATLAENTIRGAAFGIGFNVAGTGAFTNVKLDHNTVKGVSSTGLAMTTITSALVTGNNIASTGVALSVNNCPRSKFSANRFYSPSGSSSIIFGGSAAGNAGLIVMEDNDLDGIVQHDTGTGGVIREYGDSVPPTGTRAAGDTMIRLTPTVGQPKQWRYVAGTGYVSEGNL